MAVIINGTTGIDLPVALPVTEGGTGSTTAADARTNLGLELPLPVASGGTGSTTAAGARTNLGIVASIASFQATLFTASGTWTCPTGVTSVRATVVGGGGGARSTARAGGFGGLAIGIYTVVPGTGYTVTVGLGGTTTGSTANVGGTSSFSTFCSATGGSVGTPQAYGIGTGGTLANSPSGTIAVLPQIPGFWQENSFRTPTTSTNLTSALSYSISGVYMPGAAGNFLLYDDVSVLYSYASGVGGAVLLEYVIAT